MQNKTKIQIQVIAKKIIIGFLSLTFILGAGFVLSSALAPKTKAAVAPFEAFGGKVVGPAINPIAAIPGAALTCPTYTVIANFSPATNGLPPTFGVFIPAVLPGPIYSYGNMFLPGVAVLGGLLPTLCPAPIQVYPLFYNAPIYLMGTGAVPGF